MAKLTTTDLRAVLAVLYDLGSLTSADPFPLPVLDRLGTLLGAHRTGYGEFSIADGGRSYSTMYIVQNRTEPAWLAETVARLWQQDPITCRVHARAVEPMAVSDRVSMQAFHRLEFFQDVYRPFGTADSVRLYLPAPNAMSRFFFFDQEHWGLKQRERDLLGLLRPHLALWRSRSIALNRPVEISHARGFAGIPFSAHCSTAVANASCSASSARSKSPRRRMRVASTRRESER